MRKNDLYGLPLEEFTQARDALVRELRRAKKPEEAAAVKALRKPSVPVWAVNQAVRRRPQEAKGLVRAGADLRKAQRGAVSGRNPEAMKEAARAHRRLLDELTDAAREALEERGHLTPSALTRAAQTLRAASVDKEASKALAAGALADEVEQSGFGPLLSAVPAPSRARRKKPVPKPKPKPPPKPKPDPNAARRRELLEQLEQARARVSELEKRLAKLGD